MTVALRDAEALAAALRGPEGGGRSIAELTDAELRGRIARFRKQRLGLAGTINILANALHSVFSVPPDGGSSSYSSSADPLACSSATRASLRAACLGERAGGGGGALSTDALPPRPRPRPPAPSGQSTSSSAAAACAAPSACSRA